MKKHIITLGALALAVGTINFVGCGAGEDFSTNDQQGVEITDEKSKADAEKLGFNPGPPGGSQAGDGGGKKKRGLKLNAPLQKNSKHTNTTPCLKARRCFLYI